MAKYLLVGFTGELTCFAHVLINAQDMAEKGHTAAIVFEGASLALLPVLASQECPFHGLFQSLREQGLIEGACRACAAKLGVAAAVSELAIPFLDDANGHPSLAAYMDAGWKIITI